MSMLFDADKMIAAETDRIMQWASIIAYAVVAVQGRKEDDVSEKEAFEIYGKQWIISRTEKGMLHFSRNGTTQCSTKNYSRYEIECLKLAEKHILEKITQSEKIASQLLSKTEKKNEQTKRH